MGFHSSINGAKASRGAKSSLLQDLVLSEGINKVGPMEDVVKALFA